MNAIDTGKSEPLYADRVKVQPMAVHGGARRAKWIILILCLGIYYLLPWLRWDRGPNAPDQAVLLDIWNRRFYLFWIELWPQDIYLLTGFLIVAALGLFLVTAMFGRVWCGYSCPQTVWTDLFLFVERKIEGDRNARMKLDAAPMSPGKFAKRTFKHTIWLAIAFWTGGAWIMYYVDAPTVVAEFWTGRADISVYFFTGLFTVSTYLLAGWAREQVCTYMCPWPRFQSAMFDEQTLIVTYQGWRGEPRGHGRRDLAAPVKLGDCIDCAACVHACPTGIDIRDGVQLECIGCGLCVDACNHVMDKSGGKPWLITWDTLARQQAKAEGRSAKLRLLRPRTLLYATLLLMGVVILAFALVTRSRFNITVLHDRAPLYVRLANGGLRNGYEVKLANKLPQPGNFELRVEGLPDARISLAEGGAPVGQSVTILVDRDTVGEARVLVEARPDDLHDGAAEFDFVVTNTDTGEQTRYRSRFMGPGGK
jgi:cytochrome c oxidase accessory protein FixG